MRSLLIFLASILFLYSKWAPTWGPNLAIWLLIIAAFMLIGPAFAKANRPARRNHY